MDQNTNPQQQQYQPQQQQYQPQQQQYQQQYQSQYQPVPKLKGATMVKVTGILMIIGAGIGIIATLIGIAGIAALANDPLFGLGMDIAGLSMGTLYAALALGGIGAIIQLVAGIVGVINNNNKDKAGKLIIWGAVVIAFSLISAILTSVGGYSFPILNLLLGAVIPVLYIIGASQNKKS